MAEDVVFEYIITVPGYPRRVAGRQAVAELYRSYGATIVLDRCYDLAVHHDQVTGVVVLEYASRSSGTFPNTGPGGPLSPFIRKATSESDNRGRTMRLVSVRRHRLLLPTGRSRVAEFPL